MVQKDSSVARPSGAADAEAANAEAANAEAANVKAADAEAADAEAAEAARSRRFQQLALPHLDAAYNLARWLCGNPNDADDVVQEAFMRAFRFFDTFRGDSARPWLLAIVRRTWYSEWRRRASSHQMVEFDDSMDDATFDGWSAGGDDPQTLLIRDEDSKRVHEALALLPVEHREVLILRELEEMGYREIALVADVPIGTVMSRLARGRRKLAALLAAPRDEVRSAGLGLQSGSDGLQGEVVSRAMSGPAADREARPAAGSRAPDENSGGQGSAADAADAGLPRACATPLRATVGARSSNPSSGRAAGIAQEAPDGL
ncbi:RNA polymerase sigma factor [Paraburkholderia sp. PREW-6R]|uniref:RNA polymerase sigma factor n=1 Tax=Paraburkholderia sp. PREW-6R TaxID=3141544 RepID=UPI0031F562D9